MLVSHFRFFFKNLNITGKNQVPLEVIPRNNHHTEVCLLATELLIFLLFTYLSAFLMYLHKLYHTGTVQLSFYSQHLFLKAFYCAMIIDSQKVAKLVQSVLYPSPSFPQW